jgi:hypothetical protein
MLAFIPSAEFFPELKEDLRSRGGGGDAEGDERHFLEGFAVDAVRLARHVLGFSGNR